MAHKWGGWVSRVRCFVAVDVDEPSVISRVTRIQQQINGTGAKLKVVEPENLHLTLRFIGEVGEEQVDRIVRALERIEFSGFQVEFTGLGAFPNNRRPRVIWIGVRKGAAELAELSVKVNLVLSELRLPKPEEEFTPHLTIARVKTGIGSLTTFIEKNVNVEIGTMTVDSLRLKKSILTPRGPIYETLYEKKATG